MAKYKKINEGIIDKFIDKIFAKTAKKMHSKAIAKLSKQDPEFAKNYKTVFIFVDFNSSQAMVEKFNHIFRSPFFCQPTMGIRRLRPINSSINQNFGWFYHFLRNIRISLYNQRHL